MKGLSSRPVNTKITFADSDSSSSDDEEEEDEDGKEEVQVKVQEGEEKEDKKPKLDVSNGDNTDHENGTGEKSDPHKIDDLHAQAGDKADGDKDGVVHGGLRVEEG